MTRIMIDGRWANPPSAMVARIYRAARCAVPRPGHTYDVRIVDRQGWLRRVSLVFHRMLRDAGIYVEGA